MATADCSLRRKSRSPLEPHASWLLELIAQEPDLTLAEIEQRLLANRGVRSTDSSIDRFFKRHKVSFRKKSAAEQDRPDVAAARRNWKAGQPCLDPRWLVFVDETGTSIKIVRTGGRCVRSRRVVVLDRSGSTATTVFSWRTRDRNRISSSTRTYRPFAHRKTRHRSPSSRERMRQIIDVARPSSPPPPRLRRASCFANS